MLKTLLSNPVTRIFIALIISVAAVLGAFMSYITAPDSFGKTAVQFDTDTVYYIADEWNLGYDYLKFKFYPGTLVIPGYHQGRVVGVLLIPPEDYPGELSITLPEEYRGELPDAIEDNLDQALIMLDYADYKNVLRDTGDTILLRADGVTEGDIPTQYLNRQMEHGLSLLTSYDIYGFTNWLLPTPQTILVRFWGQRLGMLSYYEDMEVSVTGPDFDIQFAHPSLDTQFYPPTNYQFRAALYIIFLGFAAAGLIAFVSGAIEYKNSSIQGDYQILPATAAISGTIIYSLLLTAFQVFYQPSMYAIAALWAFPLILVGIWAFQARLEPQFFGITAKGLTAGVITAVSVSVFIALGSTFSLPTGINWNTSLALSLTLAVIFREALLRGFCQRILSHWLHPLAGLSIVSLAWAIIVVATGSGGIVLPFISALGRSFLVGYLYHRTNNLYATGLLAALLELAPQILAF